MAQPQDSFTSAAYSVDWAYSRMEEFSTLMGQYKVSDPLDYVVEEDSENGDHLHKLKLVQPPPFPMNGLAGDAIANLRSALDHSIYALSPGLTTKFPFSTAKYFEQSLEKGAGACTDPVKDYLRELAPYQGGNQMLWALNELRNQRTHALVTPVAVLSDRWRADQMTVMGGKLIIPGPNWDSERGEMLLARVGHGSSFSIQKPKAAIDFYLNTEIDFLKGVPAFVVLGQFARDVSQIVTRITDLSGG